MIEEDFVTYDTAQLLKENGFDEACDHYYVRVRELGISYTDMCYTDEPLHNSEIKYGTYKNCECVAPTLQMAVKWLREVHNLIIVVAPAVTDSDGTAGCLWKYTIYNRLDIVGTSDSLYENYECAVEQAIVQCLKTWFDYD